MADKLLLQYELILVNVAIIISFFTCLYVYRIWKSNQSLMKKVDLVYKKLIYLK